MPIVGLCSGHRLLTHAGIALGCREVAMAAARLQVEQVGDVAVVRFGECRTLDESSAQSIGQELVDLVERDGYRKVLLDMSDVGFLTSTALGKLVILHKK